MTDPILLPLSAAALAANGLITLPGLFATLAQRRDRSPPDNFYEDEDGKSSPETMAAFSNRKPKLAILTFSILGLCLSTAVTVLSLLQPLGDGLRLENWLSNASYVSRLFVFARHTRFLERYIPISKRDS